MPQKAKYINYGKLWEQEFADCLTNNNIEFTQEKSMRSYGVNKSTKGKYDFKLKNAAVECKTIGTATKLRMPWQGVKTPPLHAHQFKALRKANKGGLLSGLLIYVRDTNKRYWLNINVLDTIVIEHGMITSLNNTILDHYSIVLKDLQQWVGMYNTYSEHVKDNNK